MKPLMAQATTVLVATWSFFGCAPSPEVETSDHAPETSPAALNATPLVSGEDALRQDLTELASDTYEGRNGGYEGERLAAAYIADRFQEIGLEPLVTGKAFCRNSSFWLATRNHPARGSSHKM